MARPPEGRLARSRLSFVTATLISWSRLPIRLRVRLEKRRAERTAATRGHPEVRSWPRPASPSAPARATTCTASRMPRHRTGTRPRTSARGRRGGPPDIASWANVPGRAKAVSGISAGRLRHVRSRIGGDLTSHERSEVLVEADVAADADLVGGDGALEEVGQLLHVLELHEPERVLRPEALRQAEPHEALVGDELRYSRVSATDRPGTPSAEHVLRRTASRPRRPRRSSGRSARASSSSNRSGSSRRTVSTTAKAKSMCPLSSRNTQLVPAARPLSRPFERRK